MGQLLCVSRSSRSRARAGGPANRESIRLLSYISNAGPSFSVSQLCSISSRLSLKVSLMDALRLYHGQKDTDGGHVSRLLLSKTCSNEILSHFNCLRLRFNPSLRGDLARSLKPNTFGFDPPFQQLKKPCKNSNLQECSADPFLR